MRAIGYRRVSTNEQAESGLGLDAQTTTVEGIVAGRGGTVVGWFEDSATGKTMDRAGLVAALEALDAGDGDTLAVAKLDRLGRSTVGVLTLVERLAASGHGLVIADLGLDTTTAIGQFVLQVMAAFAELERKMISQRTRDAMAAAQARGVAVGRPTVVPPAVVDQVRALRAGGHSFTSIAAALDAGGVPTARGGPWSGSSVRWLVTERRA